MRALLVAILALSLAAALFACSGGGGGGGGLTGPSPEPPGGTPPPDPGPQPPPEPGPQPPPEPATGSIRVRVETVGEALDGDGYEVVLDGAAVAALPPVGEGMLDGLPVGRHRVDLSGVAVSCRVNERVPAEAFDAPFPLPVDVVAGETALLDLVSFCLPAGTGTIFYNSQTGFHLRAMEPNGVNDRLVKGSRTIEFDIDRAGTRIVHDDGPDLIVSAPDGSDPLTIRADEGLNQGRPAISPDGTRIAFMKSSHDHAGFDLWVANADGNDARVLVADGAHNEWPAWSPDGTAIAFDRRSTVGGLQVEPGIFTIPAAGGPFQRVTTGSDTAPSWSADGTRIAFIRGLRVHAVGADGNGLVQIVPLTNRGPDFGPRWSPDNRWIVFASERIGRPFVFDVYVARTDGSLVVRVVAQAENPHWIP